MYLTLVEYSPSQLDSDPLRPSGTSPKFDRLSFIPTKSDSRIWGRLGGGHVNLCSIANLTASTRLSTPSLWKMLEM